MDIIIAKNKYMEGNQENKEEIFIVPANPEDVKGMQEVFYKTWLDTYPNEEIGITVDDIEDRYKDRLTKESLAKRAESIANLPKDHKLFFAKEGDRVVGVCRVVNRPDVNQLQAIYVLPEYQGRGVGKLLWEEAKKNFDQNKDTIVQVVTYNKKAIEFYKKLGFKDMGKRFQDDHFTMKSGAKLPEMEMVIEKS